jgi:hypothetical protein
MPPSEFSCLEMVAVDEDQGFNAKIIVGTALSLSVPSKVESKLLARLRNIPRPLRRGARMEDRKRDGCVQARGHEHHRWRRPGVNEWVAADTTSNDMV